VGGKRQRQWQKQVPFGDDNKKNKNNNKSKGNSNDKSNSNGNSEGRGWGMTLVAYLDGFLFQLNCEAFCYFGADGVA
jgi:hypothetical protein